MLTEFPNEGEFHSYIAAMATLMSSIYRIDIQLILWEKIETL